MPRISVIIATFNRAAMLRCALRSVLLQELTDFEVIVVGDRCTDESEAVIAGMHDPRFRWINRAVNCGNQSGPNNDGIALARGELIAFLGHDDLWLPWHLSTLLAHVEAGASLAHAMVAFIGPDGVRSAVASPPVGESYRTTFIPPSAWLVRKSVLEALGGFRDHSVLARGTDHDLLRRLESSYSIANAPRLSVLKFPSHWWRAYASDTAMPQLRWLEAIISDPHEVERELLAGALLSSLSTTPNAAPRRAFAQAFRALKVHLRDLVERDVWPIAPLLRARFRRQRARLKKLRGL